MTFHKYFEKVLLKSESWDLNMLSKTQQSHQNSNDIKKDTQYCFKLRFGILRHITTIIPFKTIF